jgi:hypothetical protein
MVLRRRLHGRVRLTNHDRWFFIQLYRWFPSILQALLAKLEALLARSTTKPEEIALIAEQLSLPTGGRHRLPELSPQRRKEKTLEALLAQLSGLSPNMARLPSRTARSNRAISTISRCSGSTNLLP